MYNIPLAWKWEVNTSSLNPYFLSCIWLDGFAGWSNTRGACKGVMSYPLSYFTQMIHLHISLECECAGMTQMYLFSGMALLGTSFCVHLRLHLDDFRKESFCFAWVNEYHPNVGYFAFGWFTKICEGREAIKERGGEREWAYFFGCFHGVCRSRLV